MLVQNLLVASFQNIGGFGLVGRTGAGLMPDYTLITELQEFQAEPAGPEAKGFILKVSILLTLIRESDRRIVASQRIAATGSVASDETAPLVAGLDRVMQTVLTETVLWTRSRTGGGGMN